MELKSASQPEKFLGDALGIVLQPKPLICLTLTSIGFVVCAVITEVDALFYMAILAFPGSLIAILLVPLLLSSYFKGLIYSDDVSNSNSAGLFVMTAPVVVLACLMTVYDDTALFINTINATGEHATDVLFVLTVGCIFSFVFCYGKSEKVTTTFKQYLPPLVKIYFLFILLSLFEGMFPYKETSYRLDDLDIQNCITKAYEGKGENISYQRRCTVSFTYQGKSLEKRLKVVDLAQEFVIRHGIFEHYFTR